MWYASCSTGAHLIPLTVAPCVVLEAGASGGPASSGMPSGPMGWAGAGAVTLGTGVESTFEADGGVGAVTLPTLLPHPVRAQAAISDIRMQSRRGVIRHDNLVLCLVLVHQLNGVRTERRY